MLRLRDARSQSGVRKLDDVTRSAADRAVSSLASAKIATASYRKQLEDRQAALEESRMSLHVSISPIT